MAGTSVGWHPDPADPSKRRYWDGRRWSAPVREREALHRKREVRQQAMFVIAIMAIIAACWLLYDKPWQVHKPHAPARHALVSHRR